MKPDLITEMHAQILSRDFNFCDVENLKTERCITKGTTTSSCWFATKNRQIRCLIQYDHDSMPLITD
jgi:hypothetical protein